MYVCGGVSGARAQIKSRQQDVSCSVCRPHAAFFNFTVSRSALLFSGHTSVRTLSHTPGDRTLEHFDGGEGVQGVRSAVVTCAPSSARKTASGKLRYWGRISIYGNDRGWGGVRECECGGAPEINQLHTHPLRPFPRSFLSVSLFLSPALMLF